MLNPAALNSAARALRWRFWIDRGGTFTDVIGQAEDGRAVARKLLSVSEAYDDAAVEGMRRILDVGAGESFPAERVISIRLGSTVATNALLERKGAPTLFIATCGFADALILGDQARPDLFALNIVRPAPLYGQAIEADERLAADGAVVRPLDREALMLSLAQAFAAGFTSAAIAFLHADLNPEHEIEAGRLAQAAGFDFVALSHQVSPLPRYLARAETTVAEAYLTPAVQTYAGKVAGAVGGAPLYFMTSAGGLVGPGGFTGRNAVVSGPAGGVVGVAHTARAAGARAVLGFDMGGTSTDVCRFAGVLERRDTAKAAGVRLRSPMLDIETVAAGGGSILAFDGLRARVGPGSAGADPGPAAYGRGGPAAVTDANLVLGRIDPAAFPRLFGPAHDQPLDAHAARARLAELAEAMGAASPEAAAEGFIRVAVEQTAQAVGRISTERGFDPRLHALVAFGGAAGQIACAVAEALGIGEVLSPRYASLLSAWGIGQAAMTSLRQAGLERPLDAEGLAEAARLGERLTREAAEELGAQGAAMAVSKARLMLRYSGADAVLPVDLGPLAECEAAFADAHRRLFGFVEPALAVLIASVEVEATAAAETMAPATTPAPPARPGAEARTLGMVFDGRTFDAPVIEAAALAEPIEGPALIVRGDTQIAVAPGWRAHGEADGLIRLRRTAEAKRPRAAVHEAADPVTLELFNRRFMGVAEAMGAALERTAHSVNIKERLDFSCALFDPDGGLVANAPHMPVHLGSMGASVRAVRQRHPRLFPGQAFALNNPYAGGTHLPDITVVMPVFAGGAGARPAFYVAARGHHADVGGVQPGSVPPFSRTIEEEGVLLDALPIMAGGRFLEAETRAALTAGPWPARNPAQNLADLKAQIAACQAGAVSVSAMIEAHGAAMVRRYMGFVQDNAEACVRRAVGRLRDGQARVPMDGGGEIAVAIRIDAAKGEAVLDFSGTSGVLASNFNAPSAIVDAAALYVFRSLVEDDIPLNAGCLKPLKIILPQGCLLAPEFPAAVVAGNVETSQHVVDALYAALGVMANAQGTMNNFTFGDERRQYYETLCGGAGATAEAAGAGAVHTHMTNSRLTDPEILERRFPVRVEAFALRPGSGGAGVQRGGDGAVRRIRFLAPMQAALLATRREHAPQGIAGGGPALPGRQRLIQADGGLKELLGCFSIMAQPDDVIEIETPGGGGFGPEGVG
ncbi:MAG: hydantoinase B/oxoprolinase family protein [Caulobacteraceae bacterium]|nr:hydantoinase B/oxoprolinase family protein [Caulobacteraceae bacterium]